MKLNRRWRAQPLQLATAGMIDIVFLLLIFFLVNSSFQPTERQVESALTDPQAATADSVEEPMIVEVQVAAGVFYRVGGREFLQRDELYRWLQQWPAKSQSIIVKAPANCPIEVPIRLLNDCRRAGFERVAYLPPPEGN